MEATPSDTQAEPPVEVPQVGTEAAGQTSSITAALDLADSLAERQRGVEAGASPQRWRRLPDAIAVVAIAFAAVGIFVLGMVTHARVSDDSHAAGAQPAQAQAASSPQAAAAGPIDVSADDDPARGPLAAHVTIIEFADFQCPYCGRFHAQTLPQILQAYGDRVRFVYRDFPLTDVHAFAEKAAEAGECAHDQDGFWKYHDVLFGNQGALDRASLGRYAQTVGLDMAAFNGCLDSGKYAAEVASDLRAGVAAGVNGTPAFFVNGRPISGAQPYAVFKAAIDAALLAAK